MGQSFVGNYGSPFSTQTYTDQIQSFRIVDTSDSLSISDDRTITDAADFHRRDFRMSPVILPDGRPGIEAYGGVFTSLFGVWRQPITISGKGRIAISPYQQYFSQYDCPQIPLYSARDQTMQTLFLGGISFYYYDPAASPSINYSYQIPFINTISDLVQPSDGADQEYIMPTRVALLARSRSAMDEVGNGPSIHKRRDQARCDPPAHNCRLHVRRHSCRRAEFREFDCVEWHLQGDPDTDNHSKVSASREPSSPKPRRRVVEPVVIFSRFSWQTFSQADWTITFDFRTRTKLRFRPQV